MSKIVKKLLEDSTVLWFRDKGTAKSTNSDEKSGLITRILMAVAVVAFLGYMAYVGSRKSREIAKLKHQRDAVAEEKRQALLDWELAELDESIVGKLEHLQKVQVDLLEVSAKILEREEAAEYELFKIKAIENWDDMDRYIESIDSVRS